MFRDLFILLIINWFILLPVLALLSQQFLNALNQGFSARQWPCSRGSIRVEKRIFLLVIVIVGMNCFANLLFQLTYICARLRIFCNQRGDLFFETNSIQLYIA